MSEVVILQLMSWASIDRTPRIPEVMQLIPKDYAGDDDAIRDLVFHILVEKGFL